MMEPIADRHCRSCGASGLASVLDLGMTPLANALIKPGALAEPEPRYPLHLVFCAKCSLLQITETVPPEQLFSDYLYFSSFSETMLKHAEQIVLRMIRDRRLNGDSLVAEVASNDGYLLQYYKRAGVPVLGIEPAANVAKVAVDRGIPTVCDFFGDASASRLAEQGNRADVIHANNVLAHVADLNGVVSGFRRLLKDDGVVIVEAPYVREMLDHTEFDTIYHEHLCYFSLTALDRLFRRHGLAIFDVERLPIHGGTLRIFAANADFQLSGVQVGPAVHALLREEADWGVNDLSSYRGFGDKVQRLRAELVALLRDLKGRGKSIAVYGASAKGSTLLNYFGIGAELLDYVVDRSTVKQGHLTPGTHLPIHAPEKLLEDKPDYVLLLTWNFADEILAQQAEYRRRGGRFIVPIPQVTVI